VRIPTGKRRGAWHGNGIPQKKLKELEWWANGWGRVRGYGAQSGNQRWSALYYTHRGNARGFALSLQADL